MPSRVRIIVTTSHRPSQRVRTFAKDLASVLPGAVKVNRGKSSMRDLYYDAVGLGAERVIVIGVWKGNPGTIHVYSVPEPPETRLKPLVDIVLRGVTLRREIPGSQRLMGVEKLAIDVSSAPKEVYDVLDSLARGFLASLVADEDLLDRYDVAAKVEVRGELVVSFICPSTGRACGPRLRIVRIVDHVSERTHVFRAGGVGGEAESRGAHRVHATQ